MRSVSLCVLLLVASGCIHAQRGEGIRVEIFEVRNAAFRLEYPPEDAGTAQQVRRSLERAVPAAARWGSFSAPILITIHPTHEAFEAATRRKGFTWLRAWARRASVDVQSPRSWSIGRASDAGMEQLLAHELTHCVMYQMLGSEQTWQDRGVPVWFREGMASVTAGEQHATTGPRPDAGLASGTAVSLAALDLLYKRESSKVYGTAHRAFHFLLDRYGEERIRRLIVGVGEGRDFAEAFRRTLGIPLQEFEGDFQGHDAT